MERDGLPSFTSPFLPFESRVQMAVWKFLIFHFKTNQKRTLGRFNLRISKQKFSAIVFLNEFPSTEFCRLKNSCLSFSMNCTEVLCKVDGEREGLEGDM